MRKEHSVSPIHMTKNTGVFFLGTDAFPSLFYTAHVLYGLWDNDILGLASGLLPSHICSWGPESRADSIGVLEPFLVEGFSHLLLHQMSQ